jgi:hypothetical protein
MDSQAETDRKELKDHCEAVYADLREDASHLTNHILQVAGLGAVVGTYLVGTEAGRLKPIVLWFLILAVMSCLVAGIASGTSFFFAQIRGEKMCDRLDQALTDYHNNQVHATLLNGNAAADTIKKKWDDRIHCLNKTAAVFAGIGMVLFGLAALFVGIC